MRIRRLHRLLWSVALTALIAAGPVPLAAETLTDALIKAYQTSPLLQTNRAALRALDESVPQARSARRPQVNATAGANAQNNSRDVGNTTDVVTNPFTDGPDLLTAGLEASLLLFDSGQSAAAIESARYNVASGRATLLGIEQQILFAAVQAFMDVLRDLEFLNIAQNDVRVLTEQLDATRNRFEVGEVTRTDVSQTEARLANSRSNLAAAQGNLATSRQAYLAAVGTLPGNLTGPPPLPQLPASPPEAVAIALRQNPQIIAAQFNERAAISDFDRARAAKGISLQAQAEIFYEGKDYQSFNSGATTGDDLVGQIGLGATLPLSTGGRNDSLIRQAQQVLDQRKFELQDTARSVTEAVNNAWTELMVARATIVSNQQQVEAATIAFEGVREEARLGARSTLDVLDADQERLQALAELVRSRRNEYVAGYAVLQAVGLLTVRHLGLGIETYDPDVNYVRVERGRPGGYDTSAVDRIRSRWQQ